MNQVENLKEDSKSKGIFKQLTLFIKFINYIFSFLKSRLHSLNVLIKKGVMGDDEVEDKTCLS